MGRLGISEVYACGAGHVLTVGVWAKILIDGRKAYFGLHVLKLRV